MSRLSRPTGDSQRAGRNAHVDGIRGIERFVGPLATATEQRTCKAFSLQSAETLRQLDVVRFRFQTHLPMNADRVNGRLCFGVFELDLRAGELRKRGLRVRLQQQPFQVLAILIEHSGQVVSREELQKTVWPADTFVDFDHGLNKAINKIREALGDSAESPRFVETVARRGYRFIADVKVAEAAPAPVSASPAVEPQPATPARDRHGLAGVVARLTDVPAATWKISTFVLLALLAALAAWKVYSGHRPSPIIRSLAVLPLESLSNDASQDYFADGMTDELITDLGRIRALRVIRAHR